MGARQQEFSALRVARRNNLGEAILTRGELTFTFRVCAPAKAPAGTNIAGAAGLEAEQQARWQLADPVVPEARPAVGDLLQAPRGAVGRVETVRDYGKSWVVLLGVQA